MPDDYEYPQTTPYNQQHDKTPLAKQLTNHMNLDENMVNLVHAINMLHGITTFSSCGGHDNPNVSQAPKNEWYVNFDVDIECGGYNSLRYLTQIVYSYLDPETITISTWWNGDDDEGCLCFEIKGKNIDPDEVAEEI